MPRHGVDVRIAADGGGGDVERRQIRPAERAFRDLRGVDGNDALDLTVGRQPGDARAAPVTDPEMALRHPPPCRRDVPDACSNWTKRRGSPGPPPSSLGVDRAAARVSMRIDRLAVGAERRPVRDDDIVPEAHELLAVPAPERARRLGLVVVHGAEIKAAVRPHMAVVDAVARLVRLGRDERLDLAAPQVEPDEARLEPRDHDIGIVASAPRSRRAPGTAMRECLPVAGMVAPDCRVLDVDP